MSLRRIGEVTAGLLPKIAIHFHFNLAMSAAAPADALDAFIAANSIRRQAGLSWAQVLSDANGNNARADGHLVGKSP